MVASARIEAYTDLLSSAINDNPRVEGGACDASVQRLEGEVGGLAGVRKRRREFAVRDALVARALLDPRQCAESKAIHQVVLCLAGLPWRTVTCMRTSPSQVHVPRLRVACVCVRRMIGREQNWLS